MNIILYSVNRSRQLLVYVLDIFKRAANKWTSFYEQIIQKHKF